MKEFYTKEMLMVIKKKNIKNIIFFILIILFYKINLYSLENKILFKVNNEIITSLDLENEINYLTSLNPNLRKLKQKEIIEISKKSIINEKIKKIEIHNFIENPNIPKELLDQFIKNIYIKIGINNLEDFKKYLKLNNVDYKNVLIKIETEALWNELIIYKFSNKLKIDNEKLKKKVRDNLNNSTKSFLMSEILFQIEKDEKVRDKYQEIRKSIIEKGFNNTALKYSISETANFGGKLNWINENSLNNEIKEILNSKKINEFTQPIRVASGFLVLKINDIKIIKTKKNFEEELKKLINSNRNNQLNQFSKMYFNKIKGNVEINEI